MSRAERLPDLAVGVAVADFETELVVMVGADRRAHHLDEGLSLVVDACASGTARSGLVAEVAAATGEDTQRVEEWLDSCLSELQARGILIDAHDA